MCPCNKPYSSQQLSQHKYVPLILTEDQVYVPDIIIDARDVVMTKTDRNPCPNRIKL